MIPDVYDIIYIPLGAAAHGGAELSLLDLCSGMAERGKKGLILAEKTLRNTYFSVVAVERGLKVEWVDWLPDQSIWHNLISAIRAFRKFHARIIHFNISWRRGMWLIPLVARIVTRSRLLGTMRAMPDPHHLTPRRRRLGFIPGLRLWHWPEVLVGLIWARLLHMTVSINARDYPVRLTAHYGFSPHKIRVIYNGIHVRLDLLPEFEKRKLREALGLKEDDILLSYVGRISASKGISHLLEALAQLPERFQLTIIGDGAQKGELKSQVQKLRLQSRVRFLGFVDHPDDLIAASDLVVVPSVWYEPFGRVVVEAMNQGVPVVASCIGGMAELFDDGIQGVYVTPKDVNRLAEVLQELGNDQNRLQAMGMAGRELVKSRYSLERVIGQYAQLYDELNGDSALSWYTAAHRTESSKTRSSYEKPR